MDAVEESVQMSHCASVSGDSAQRCARDQKDAMRCDLVCHDQQPLPEMAIPSQGSPPNDWVPSFFHFEFDKCGKPSKPNATTTIWEWFMPPPKNWASFMRLAIPHYNISDNYWNICKKSLYNFQKTDQHQINHTVVISKKTIKTHKNHRLQGATGGSKRWPCGPGSVARCPRCHRHRRRPNQSAAVAPRRMA